MSIGKSKKPIIDPKKALPELKKLGLFKTGDHAISGRGKLTDSQKRRIRKAYEENKFVINTPRSEFKVKDVSYYEKKDIAALKRAGYHVINNKVYLTKQGSQDVEIKRNHVQKIDAQGKQRKGYETIITIKRELKDGTRVETEYLGEPATLTGWRDNLLRDYQSGNFKEGDFIGMKIGRGSQFFRSTMLSLQDVYKYLENDFDPKDPNTDKQQLLLATILVKIEARNWRDVGKDMQTKKEKDALARKRSKKAATVKRVAKPLNGVAKKAKKK